MALIIQLVTVKQRHRQSLQSNYTKNIVTDDSKLSVALNLKGLKLSYH